MLLATYFLFPLILVVLCVPATFSLALQIELIDAEALDELRSGKKNDEFMKNLGIKDASLCYPSTDVNMEPMFNKELPYGDLLMDEKEMEKTNEEEDQDTNDVENDFADDASSPRQKGKKSKKKPKKWAKGVVPYYISRDFTSKQRQKIKDAIEEMNSKIESVHFRPTKKSDKNYVFIFSGKGCYANLGMKGGQQPVSLQADICLKRGTIQHELLHVLGFMHEHNRPDRDDYIEVEYKNIPKVWHKSYRRSKSYEAIYVGSYDYYSVMHYPPEAPQSKGKKFAFYVLEDNVDLEWVGHRKGISDLDIQKAEELYSDE